MTRIIGVVSGKGGVGKTTVVANLGAALRSLDKNVVLVDANVSTPALALSYGLYSPQTTLNDVLWGRAEVPEAMYIHHTGVRLIPASFDINDFLGIDLSTLRENIPSRYALEQPAT